MNQVRVSRRLITAAACACRFAGMGYRAGVPYRHRRPGKVQVPKTSPLARSEASMAYDAATGNAVLFGGVNSSYLPAQVADQ
jgi:hypothetical protein